jgi:violaxanthin de-epoxidase
MKLPVLPTDAMRGALCGLLVMGSTIVTPPAAIAAQEFKMDGAKIGKCLLSSCQLPLARCVADPICAANLVCIQTCTGRVDEAACQIKCGDEFSNDVVGDFTKCAVSDKKCVPQRPDDGSWPVPQPSTLVEKFSPENMLGPWYISAGLNTEFDTFDCQLHKFESPADNKLVGNLQWRIKDPIAGTNFVTRYTVQEFVQDAKYPGILYNHDNDFLHYQDDWYILGAKDEAYVVVYYRGSNDAWDGYGGAVIYSREPKLPRKYFAEIDEALKPVGYSMEDFTLTDNSCRAAETKLEELEADLEFVETRVASGFSGVERSALDEISKDVKRLSNAEKRVVKEIVNDFQLVEREVERDLVAVEQEVERVVKGLFRR